MSVTLLNVLNTVAPLGADAFVDANGFLNLQGTPAFKTSSIDSVTITPYVAEVAQASTVTISTVSNNAVYSLSLICNDVNSGMITSVPLTVTSDSTATNTEIATAFAAAINGMPELSVTAAVSMSALVVTAKAGFPIFTLTTSDSKLSISTSAGTVGVGTGTSLIGTYPSTAGYFNAGGFTAAASIVATNNYTQVLVSSTTGSSAVILINVGATAANVASLIGTYGTLTGLKNGYRVIIPASASQPTGNISISSYVATAATAGQLALFQLQSGDFIVSGTSVAKIGGVATAATAVTSLETLSSATYTIAYWRNLPL
jgi:hypothetical protein